MTCHSQVAIELPIGDCSPFVVLISLTMQIFNVFIFWTLCSPSSSSSRSASASQLSLSHNHQSISNSVDSSIECQQLGGGMHTIENASSPTIAHVLPVVNHHRHQMRAPLSTINTFTEYHRKSTQLEAQPELDIELELDHTNLDNNSSSCTFKNAMPSSKTMSTIMPIPMSTSMTKSTTSIMPSTTSNQTSTTKHQVKRRANSTPITTLRLLAANG